MRYLMTTAAIAPALAALATGVAQAETTIATARTTPVLTSTATGTAADDVTISTAGSVTVTSGAAVTVDSNNKVANAGAIKITGADNATGILVRPGTTGAIDNSGSITLDEDYTATDTDSDGDIDGGFAQGTGRNGIWVQAGTAHAGAITHSGSITVEGMSAAGIRLDGALNGTLATSGTITVTGDNGHGVLANGVSGNVTLRGSTSVVGANSVGAALLGDIGGALKIQGTIISTGYRSTTRPTDVTKLDADDLLQGGGAVKISGNVAGGIIFDTPPVVDSTNTSTDQDGDGLTDSTEGSAAIISYGSAAAVAIGATDRDIAIGAVGTSGRGLIINGSISGTGIYDGVSGQGLVIGGLGGGVTITGGMNVNGGIYAYSVDSNATAVRLGSGARVDAIGIAGTVGASGSTLAGTSVRAVVIDSGATSGSIAVSGAVVAAALDSAKGSAIAILDSSGTVSSLSNSGRISASGGLTNVAIDMSANAGGVMLTQMLAKEGATAPSIIGDIRLGAGNDTVTLSAGSLTGNVALGAGNDSLSLAGASTLTGHVGFGAGTAALSLGGTAKLAGTVDFGGGTGTLTLGGTSVLAGTLANSGAIAVNLTGGTLDIASTGPVALASLDAGAGSTIGVRIDGTSDTNTVYTVAGSANFATGSLVKATLANVAGSAGDYVIVKAGSLSGTPALSGAGTLLPYMFKGSIASDAASGEVVLSVAAKSVAELGLSGSTARAYAAIFNALDQDAAVASAYLAVADGATLDSALQQMLPDHAGGTFEAVTSGSRATARILSDPGGLYRSKDGRFGMWLTQVAYGSAKSVGSTASYDITGWGVSGGGEYLSDIGAFGASLAYLHGNDAGGGASHAVTSDQFELAAHWRGQWGPLQGFARVSAAQIDFAGERRFVLGNVSRIAQGDWSGRLYSATVGASYEARFGRISLRPAAGIDYYRLNEGSYAESGGGDAFNLTVDGRTSDETTANGTLTVAYDIGSLNRADGWARIELEGGRRQILSGSLGDTTAHFGDGDAFTLVAQDRTNGWTGRARLIGGTDSFRVGGEFSAEQQQNHVAIALRATVHFAL